MKYAVALLLAFVSLAADAGVFATATAPNGRVVILYDDECPPGEKKTYKVDLMSPAGARMYSGCWYADGTLVEILWEDKDTSTIPIRFFELGQGKKHVPQS